MNDQNIKYYVLCIIMIGLSVMMASCSQAYHVEPEGTWVSENSSFSISNYQDDTDSFYVLTYLSGDFGTYTFNLDHYSFRFFIRRRVEQQGEYVFVKDYLSDQQVTFRMGYHIKTGKIHLIHLTMNAEPIIFTRQIIDEDA